MVLVANRIPVAKGYEGQFEKIFEGRTGGVEKMPGFVRYNLLRPVKGDCYVVMTVWDNIEAFENWTRSPEFKEAHSKHPPREIFSGTNVLEVHEVIGGAEGR